MTGARRLPRRLGAGWSRLSGRERVLLGCLAMGLAVYGAVEIVVRPLLAARQQARAAIAQNDAALDRLSAAAVGPAAAAMASLPVPAVLTDTAPDFGLAIRRLESDGEGAQVLLETADFASIVLWLEELERGQSIGVVSAQLDRSAEPGTVTARLGLSR